MLQCESIPSDNIHMHGNKFKYLFYFHGLVSSNITTIFLFILIRVVPEFLYPGTKGFKVRAQGHFSPLNVDRYPNTSVHTIVYSLTYKIYLHDLFFFTIITRVFNLLFFFLSMSFLFKKI